MARPVKPRRRYDSTRRRQRAAETRRAILTAAKELFIARGWAGTTLQAVAGQAGVALETVYAGFGNKRSILAELIALAVRGPDDERELLRQPGPQAVRRQRDRQAQIEAFAAGVADVLPRVAPLMAVLAAAAATAPELATLYREMHLARLRNMRRVAGWLARNGRLRDGMTPAAVARQLWTMTSPELYLLLTDIQGLSPRRYRDWLAQTLVVELLPPA